MKPDDDYERLSSTFARACRDADARFREQAQAKRAAPARPPTTRVAASTLMAAEFMVRLNDPKRFENWLMEYSADERAAICAHINSKKDKS